MNYITRKFNLEKSQFLDEISQESGKLYSQTVKTFWRIVRKNSIWLSSNSMEKIVNSNKLHAHSADASVQAFYDALSSWREVRKINPYAKPPKRLKKYYPVIWKSNAIRLKNNQLILSNGRNQKPIIVDNWKYEKPKYTIMSWNGKEYQLNCYYIVKYNKLNIEKEKPVAVDLGQIHLATCSDGMILNGRYLRSLIQWRNKKCSDYQAKMGKMVKGSNNWKKMNKKKHKFLDYVNNKIDDVLHKLTTGLVLTQKNNGVNTLIVGDLTGYRINNDIGNKRNQENHGWNYGKITHMLKYKCEKYGLKFIEQEESYTSQTCPKCKNRYKPKNRNYKCKVCGFEGHRDVVGATNILLKYLGKFDTPQVVADMILAFGIRYKPNINVTCGFKCKSLNLQESTGF